MAWDTQIDKFVGLVSNVDSSLLNILYVVGKLQLGQQDPAGNVLLLDNYDKWINHKSTFHMLVQ